MAFAGKTALTILDRIGNDNRKGEFYLTDAVAVAREMGLKAVVVETEEDEVRGINTKAQLAEAEAVLQQRLRKAALEAGVTMVAPETVFLSADTKFGRDVVIEPNRRVRSRRHRRGRRGDPLVLASRGRPCRQGRAASAPIARLRPGADLGEDVHIGNFVEVKEADDRGRRQGQPPRLYRRRAASARAPISAPAPSPAIMTASPSTAPISARAPSSARIPSLVAPVKIGDGAYVGSGSVVTKDVPPDALAIARGRQVVKEGWA